jgi:glycosyltransferase involved in cell wall biosynthesis
MPLKSLLLPRRFDQDHMRLLYFSPGYPPLIGGGETYVQALARAMAGRGHAVTVVTSQAESETDYWLGVGEAVTRQMDGAVQLVRVPIRRVRGGRGALFARRQLMMLLARLPGNRTRLLVRLARSFPALQTNLKEFATLPPADLIHAFNLSWEHPALLASQLAAARGLPFVLTPFAHVGPDVAQRSLTTVTMAHQRWLLADADAVLVLTKAVSDGLARAGVVCRHIAVLGGAIDPPAHEPDAQALVRLPTSQPFLLFLGRVSRDKGALDAAKAIVRLQAAGHDLHLVLAGTITEEFRRYYDRLPPAAQRQLHPLGPISETMKQALLAACLGLTLPSRVDALGLVLLEAWWHERPVVAAAAGGIPGIVRDEQTGLLVPYGDIPALARAFERLAEDPTLQETLGRQGRQELLAAHTWDRVADRAEAAYRATRNGLSP